MKMLSNFFYFFLMTCLQPLAIEAGGNQVLFYNKK